MMRIKELNKELIIKSKEELSKTPSSKLSIKLKAIAALGNNSIGKVSEVFGFSRNTLKSWVRGFSKNGVEGLKDKQRQGRVAKLTAKQQQEILELVKNYKENWTLFKLQKEILVRYEIKISHMSIFRLLKKHGLSYVKPRPKHYKQDENQVQEFKKKATRNYKKQPE
jgi:putative transposase